MASPETSREYSQDNKKENFSSQEAEKVLKETKDELSSLKLDIFNKSSKKEIKGWDINELEKASELIWSFYEIKKDPTSTKLNNEIVTFNIDAVKSYLETLYKRLSAKDAPWYSIMAQEKIFWSAVLAIQIALESIYRPAPQVWTYDVWVINWKLDDKTKEVITDFQRDFIWSKWADWKPGKNTIWKIIEKLWDKYATIDKDKKPRINLNFPARPEIAEKDNNILYPYTCYTLPRIVCNKNLVLTLKNMGQQRLLEQIIHEIFKIKSGETIISMDVFDTKNQSIENLLFLIPHKIDGMLW